MRQRPPIPESATHFWTGLGYKPVSTIHKWEWSDTFGKWGAIVTFEEGGKFYTYPHPYQPSKEIQP